MGNKLSDKEILTQLPAARRRGAKEAREGLLGLSVSYDKATRRFLLELSNGALLGVPVASLAALAKATPRQLSRVELTPAGGALHFEELDADFSVPGIVLATLGRQVLAKAFAGVGGSAISDAKAIAARANGAKGGRPRKQAAR